MKEDVIVLKYCIKVRHNIMSSWKNYVNLNVLSTNNSSHKSQDKNLLNNDQAKF